MDGAFLVGVVIGSLVMGALVGLIPLIVGLKKQAKGLAIAGFVACIVANFILGLLLSLPVAIVFLIIIIVTTKNKTES